MEKQFTEDHEKLSLKREGYWRALSSFRSYVERERAIISSEDFENLRDNSLGREEDVRVLNWHKVG